jgi:hypothetical protein
MIIPAFATIEEVFLYCWEMNASLSDRLDAFENKMAVLLGGCWS